MGLNLTYYLADFQTGNLIDTIPLESVSLSSSLRPGAFAAQLDMRKTGRSMAEGRALLNLMRAGKTTLVPIQEGLSTGPGNPPVSREMGEWWISRGAGSYASPIVTIGGPEFAGYASHVVLWDDFVSQSADPVVVMRQMLWDLYTTSQSVTVDLQSWISHTGARVEIDARKYTDDHWSAIQALTDAADGPFEWVIRSGLVQSGWIPTRVTRRLEVGQPTLGFSRNDITLEVSGPGKPPASLLDASWGWDEEASASVLFGMGNGAGAKQIGPVQAARSRQTGEPVKTRLVTDRASMSLSQLRRTTRAALRNYTPEERARTATMPVDRYTPRTGEVYQWRSDESWTRPAESGTVRCVGWSWSSQSPDVYELDLVR